MWSWGKLRDVLPVAAAKSVAVVNVRIGSAKKSFVQGSQLYAWIDLGLGSLRLTVLIPMDPYLVLLAPRFRPL